MLMRKDVFTEEDVRKFKDFVQDEQCKDRVGSVTSAV